MKKILILLIVLAATSSTFAQWGDEEMDEKANWQQRVFTGGGLGMAFSSYQDYISISPLIGYMISPKLAAGVQFQYRYSKYKAYTPKISTNDYGISPFVRYNVFSPIFLHAEYEYLNYEYPNYQNTSETFREGYNSFMAGGGFFQPVGRRAGFYVLALYNFNYSASNTNTPYDSPLIIRAGITAGF